MYRHLPSAIRCNDWGNDGIERVAGRVASHTGPDLFLHRFERDLKCKHFRNGLERKNDAGIACGCRRSVTKEYGDTEPIEIRLRGGGFPAVSSFATASSKAVGVALRTRAKTSSRMDFNAFWLIAPPLISSPHACALRSVFQPQLPLRCRVEQDPQDFVGVSHRYEHALGHVLNP